MTLKVPAPLDPGFRPLEVEVRAYEKDVKESGRGTAFAVLILRNQGCCDHYKMDIFQYLVQFLSNKLWAKLFPSVTMRLLRHF